MSEKIKNSILADNNSNIERSKIEISETKTYSNDCNAENSIIADHGSSISRSKIKIKHKTGCIITLIIGIVGSLLATIIYNFF